MGHSLFISDLHLCESRPVITKTFIHFLQTTATYAQALYILGDLFEYWAGDDAISTGKDTPIIEALRHLADKNVSVYVMHGNRDFLLGENFAKAAGVTLLPDPYCASLHGKPVLLTHGDALCTDDIAYQAFRNEVRTDVWKNQFLNQPLTARIATIEQLRTRSEQEKSIKSMLIMDVNQNAVEHLLAQFDYPPLLIHGHTHRPNKHLHQLNQHSCERWVLGDWYEQGSYLKLDAHGCKAQAL